MLTWLSHLNKLEVLNNECDRKRKSKMEYITKDGWVVTQAMYNEIKEICPNLSFEEILRLVDLFKHPNFKITK